MRPFRFVVGHGRSSRVIYPVVSFSWSTSKVFTILHAVVSETRLSVRLNFVFFICCDYLVLNSDLISNYMLNAFFSVFAIELELLWLIGLFRELPVDGEAVLSTALPFSSLPTDSNCKPLLSFSSLPLTERGLITAGLQQIKER